MDNMDTEKSSYSSFERFLFFLTPIVFTLVLVLVLLTMFNYDIKSSLLSVAGKIPIVNSWLPESTNVMTQGEDETGAGEGEGVTKGQTFPPSIKIKDLEAKLISLQGQLKTASDASAAKDAQIESLTKQISALKTQNTVKSENTVQYDEQVKGLADVYAKMSPSKSAPIIENLTKSEQVLVLSQMKDDDQTRILEKMEPKKAAEASILLKDSVKSSNLQIKALQERLDQYTKGGAKPSSTITRADLAQTIASMTPGSAADMLLEMNKTSKEKVLQILNAMDTAARSRVLSSMTELSKTDTAKITTRLGN
ncbi:hypothetical protein SY83_16040 [Paenibacillus swuensis]|uniref:Magnesium transporter MgtE intracellular domain-containing protein n=1 Tax=Paenibacillus swuensis TaxID=1178515 RepID=A0A172TKG6_9BACL|nr:hypothetical protein [Paenibacillus swuensis]ANE47541.1 hypothetical protein SY83_16040 [Paenibacillus swuensis]